MWLVDSFAVTFIFIFREAVRSVLELSEGKTPRFLSGFFLLNAKDGEVIAWNGGETREVMEKQPKYVNSGYPAPWYPLQTRLWLKLKKQ